MKQVTNVFIKELYDKRFNIIIHGLGENLTSPQEKHEKPVSNSHEFMTKGLKIVEPSSIHLVDIHQMLQSPVYKNGKKVNRPIIIKLINAADKRLIFNNLKFLKSYNALLRERNLNPVYITEHFPKKFQLKEQKIFALL